jgi:hypothetical protein
MKAFYTLTPLALFALGTIPSAIASTSLCCFGIQGGCDNVTERLYAFPEAVPDHILGATVLHASAEDAAVAPAPEICCCVAASAADCSTRCDY